MTWTVFIPTEVMQDASAVTLLQLCSVERCRTSNVLICPVQGTYVPSSAAFSRRASQDESPHERKMCDTVCLPISIHCKSQMLPPFSIIFHRGHAWHWTSMKCFVALPKPFAPGTLGSLRLISQSLKLQIGHRLKQIDFKQVYSRSIIVYIFHE